MSITIKNINHAIALVFKDGVLSSGSTQTEDLVLEGGNELGRINLKTTEFSRSELESWNVFINPVPKVAQPTSNTEDATTKVTVNSETGNASSSLKHGGTRNSRHKAAT